MCIMGTTDRVKQFIDYKGISKYKFCQQLGFSNKFLDNSSNMGTDKAGKILRHYPDLNPEWLLTGEGEMLKVKMSKEAPGQYPENKQEESSLGVSKSSYAYSQKNSTDELKDKLILQQEKNIELMEEITRLKKENSRLKKQSKPKDKKYKDIPQVAEQTTPE